MAYYQQIPDHKKKKNYANSGKWEEEGMSYRQRDGKLARSSHRQEGVSRPQDGHRPAPRKPAGRMESQEPVRPEKNYRDFEFHPESRHEMEAEDRSAYILSGRNPIREALKNGRDLEKLLVQKGELSGSAREIVSMAKEQKIHVQVVEKARLDEIAPHHQGLVAIASAYEYATVEDILKRAADKGEAPFLVLLDGITDPHNLGAIIRTAECAGAHGVIIPQHRSVGLTPAAVKASAGAVEHVPVARVMNLNRAIEELQQRGIWVYALTMEGTDYEQVTFQGGVALVIGSEGEGISRLTLEKCDQAVSLPLCGQLDSLNASVAAGIVLYRVLSCRRGS